MKHRGWLAVATIGLMAFAGPALAPAAAAQEPAAAAAPDRDPELRQIDVRKDAAALARLETIRAKLPEEFRKRNNFAWAVAKIDGVDKAEYFAHSGIQNFDGLSAEAAQRIRGISFSPEKGKGRFQTLFVDYRGNVGGPDALPRWFDTEYKILEDIAARLPNRSAAGTLRLYTNLEPCPSCRGVMEQFLALYTNVQMEVLYEWP